MFGSYTSGLLLGLSLIVAIGAQNAYILRQAIRREHHWLVASLCSLSDLGLILLGVMGLGAVIQASPRIETVLYLGGAAFLAHHAYRAGLDAVRAKQALTVETAGIGAPPRRRGIALNALALSWLNPHAWLDTAVLLGTFSLRYHGGERAAFAGGAISGSVLWFFGITLLAATLSRWLKRPKVWRAINIAVTAIMIYAATVFLQAGITLIRS
ncbi:LysE/ArgO family amino acid transporter [Acidihalobacter prosperus]|uniref:Amino acid transporter n=1 Tax=Acidihalobacter prosperus TaxID=160660 RepID=A0A1A6C1X5_9GAMM|nr:LysE family transporter [Acidihalobacter prosperus]OBS08567.1 hypothetical protein Thpro_022817 [Acidihalobacter prosperus]